MKKLSVLFVTLATVASITLAGCANAVSSTEPDPTEPDPIVTHTVVFDSNGGSVVATQTVNDGSTVAKPADPTNGSHVLISWFNGDME